MPALHIRGVSYYPEYWPEERWETDIKMMKETGIQVVRIAEFAWANLEPEDGVFKTDWLVQFLKLLKDNELKTIICTPSACPPKWLTDKYPETRLVEPDGSSGSDYLRKHYCPNSSEFWGFTVRITKKLAEITKDFDNITAWQIDNEMGPHEAGRCFCYKCETAFQQWLKNRYENIDGLSKAWGTDYWSQMITSFEQIELPKYRVEPSLVLDHSRFVQDSIVNLYKMQKQALLDFGITLPITTNFMGPMFEGLNYWEFSKEVDIAAYDCYCHALRPETVALGFDIFRNIKNDFFWLTETGTMGVADGENSELRLWAYRAIARGSRGHMYFRWRTCLSGFEYEHPAVLTHSGHKTKAFEQIKYLFSEWDQISEDLEKIPLPECEAAIVFDWESIFQNITPTTFFNEDISKIQEHFLNIYSILFEKGVNVDVIPPGRDISKYKLVILPGLALSMENEKLTANLEQFADDGGIVLGTAGLFTKNIHNNYHDKFPPAGLSGIFGLNTGETRSVNTHPDRFWHTKRQPVRIMSDGVVFEAKNVAEELLLHSAQSIAEYENGFLKGTPAVTLNSYGKGQSLYTGTVPGRSMLTCLLKKALDIAEIEVYDIPLGVEYVNCSPYHFYINATGDEQSVKQSSSGNAIIGIKDEDRICLPPYGVCIVKEVGTDN
jgi:beta-galactosidase